MGSNPPSVYFQNGKKWHAPNSHLRLSGLLVIMDVCLIWPSKWALGDWKETNLSWVLLAVVKSCCERSNFTKKLPPGKGERGGLLELFLLDHATLA